MIRVSNIESIRISNEARGWEGSLWNYSDDLVGEFSSEVILVCISDDDEYIVLEELIREYKQSRKEIKDGKEE